MERMTMSGKAAEASSVRVRAELKFVLHGAATVGIHDSLADTRKRLRSGSIAGDWQMVGHDLRRAIETAKREFEAA